MAKRDLGLATVLAAVACGTCSDDSVSLEQACVDYASAQCTKVQECAPLLVQVLFGDFATCAARFELGCKPALQAPGSVTTPNQAEDCAKAMRAASCGDLFSGTPLPACKTHPGTVTDGMACGAHAQCMSSYCNRKQDAGCGVCGPKGGTGAECFGDEGCQEGLVCNNGKCAARVAAGGACDDTHPCRIDLTCRGKACSTLLAAGATCVPADGLGACDFAHGLYCNPVTKVCQTLKVAKPGEPCGLIGPEAAACQLASECKMMGGSGTCAAIAADGAACDDLTGPKCLIPARCVSGACKLDDPASCK